MIERITILLQRAAVILADSRSYGSAAEQLNIRGAELRTQIAELEKSLGFEVFSINGQDIKVTDAGALFINACRAFLAIRNQDQN